jgi:FkbM family methyltransferase
MKLRDTNNTDRKKLYQRLKRLPLRILELRQIMTLKEVMRVALAPRTGEDIRIHLSPSGREVYLRCGTSDLPCLEKVFRMQEYKSRFPIEPKVIMDVGANIGMATLYYSQLYPKAKIIAIEPESSNYKMLVKNCSNLMNVTLIEGALWSAERPLVIQDPSAEKWMYTVAEVRSPSASGLQEVRAVTVPGIMKSLGVDHIDILKIDIEGAEYELFNNGAQTWLGAVGQIVIELHDRFRPGCARSFYAAVGVRPFIQEIGGENTFIKFEDEIGS